MTRLLSGVALAAAALGAILFLPLLALRVMACGIAALAAHEYLRAVGHSGVASRWSVIAGVVYVCWWMSTTGPVNLVYVFLIALGWVAFEVIHENRTIPDAAADLVAPLYIGLPLGMLVAVHMIAGWQATLLLIGTVVVSDSAQYYSGRMFGRRPLAPAISPTKTIEGAVGGVFFGTLFMVLAGARVFPNGSVAALALVGAAVVTVGIVGDLFESRLKRIAGLKDSSHLIPGHGGVLDRIDALLFATPVFYLVVRGMA